MVGRPTIPCVPDVALAEGGEARAAGEGVRNQLLIADHEPEPRRRADVGVDVGRLGTDRQLLAAVQDRLGQREAFRYAPINWPPIGTARWAPAPPPSTITATAICGMSAGA